MGNHLSVGQAHWRHVLVFAHETTALTAELIVPSHVEGFVEGRLRPVDPEGQFRYSFDTSEKMSDRAIKDIVKLTHAHKMLLANYSY
jgi:hypothetical protein